MWHQALDALYGEGTPAYALVGASAQSASDAYVTDLRAWAADPTRLPQYFTARAPQWFLDLPDDQKQSYLNRPGWISTRGNCGPGQHAREKAEWDEAPDLLWIEVDYLLVNPRSGYQTKLPERGLTEDEVKKLQHDAVAWALQASGFPATVMVSSGSKSVHVAVRLSDDHSTRMQYRQEKHLRDHLAEMLNLALGDLDVSVLDAGGSYGWVRTPGATRASGAVQEVLYVNNRTFSLAEVLDWCKAQLNPSVVTEVTQRPPISPRSKKWLGHKWRLDNDREWCWRDTLLWPMPVGAGGGNTPFGGVDDWMFRLNSELAQAGQRQPKMVVQPNPSNPTGTWEASFLFFVQAYVVQYMTAKAGYPGGGWFFTQGDDDGWRSNRRVKWPVADLTEKVEHRAEYRARDAYHAEVVDVWEAQLPSLMEQYRAGTLRVKAPKGSGLRFDRALKPKASRSSGGGGGGFDPRGYALAFMRWFNKPLKVLGAKFVDHRHPFYVFNGVHWQHTTTDWLMTHITAFLVEHPIFNEEGNMVPVRDNAKQEIFKALRTEGSIFQNSQWVQNEDAIAFSNGTLYIDKDNGIFTFNTAHIPDDNLLHVLPYAYDPCANAPLFDEFLAKVLPDATEREAVLQYMGCTFVSGRLTKDFMLLQGSADCGKSTLLDIVRELVGKENYAAFSLPGLHEQFALQDIYDKKLIFDADVPEKQTDKWPQITGKIKQITGNDDMSIPVKNSAAITSKITAQVFLASNERPRFVDSSDGLWRRLIIIPMNHPIPRNEQSTSKRDRMLQETAGIANRALGALLRLLNAKDAQGNPAREVVRSERMLEEAHAYRVDSDSALGFMTNYGYPDATRGKLHMETVHLAYKQFCDREGLGTLSYPKFCKRLADDREYGKYVKRIRIGSQMRECEIAGWPESRPFPTYEQRKVKQIREFVIEGMSLACHLPASAPILAGQTSVPDVPREKQGTIEDRRPIPFPRRNA